MDSLSLAQLSYEAGIRALDLQERGVEQLRARTGVLMAASSLTASFLGGQTIERASGLGALSGAALLALACSIALCVYVLLPKRGFVFSLNPRKMYEVLFDVADDDEELRRRLIIGWMNTGKATSRESTSFRATFSRPPWRSCCSSFFGRGRWRITSPEMRRNRPTRPTPPPPPPPAPADLGNPETRGGLGPLTK
jgi:hypothetical protein